jgi:hypothetical protein
LLAIGDGISSAANKLGLDSENNAQNEYVTDFKMVKIDPCRHVSLLILLSNSVIA